MLTVSSNHIVLGGGSGGSGGGGGDVKGAASSTDNAIARFDGATGKILQNSGASIGDDGCVLIGGAATKYSRLTVGGASGTTSFLPSAMPTYTTGIGKVFHPSGWSGNGFVFSGVSPAASRAFSLIFNGTNAYLGILDDTASTCRIMLSDNGVGISSASTLPTARLDVDGTFRSRASATFDGQIIDNSGSTGTDGQVLKKVGGQVLWSNP